MYEVNLDRKTIQQILDTDFNNYFIPLIQREFVWDEDNIKEFIESILKGYPVGIIITFKTNLEIPSVPFIDNSKNNKKENQEKLYIIDGQQRLTSLLLIKENWKFLRGGKLIERTPIFYNKDDKKLRIKSKSTPGIDFSELINKYLRGETQDLYVKGYQDTIFYLRQNFLNREIPFYIIETKKIQKNEEEIYKDVAEMFIRINRSGVELGNLQMFLSFFATVSGLARLEISNLHKDMQEKYSLDLEPIIRFIFSNLGLSQHQITKIESFKKAIRDIKEKYSDENIKQIIEKSKKSILITMELLKKDLGISTTLILPSETVLVPLFKYINIKELNYIDELSDNDKRKIIKWFILASYHGLYSSRTDSKLETDLKIIKDSKNGFPIEALLNSMEKYIKTREINENDFKNINFNILRGKAGKKYLFILHLLLVKNNATDWAGNFIIKTEFKSLTKHHIFPRDKLKEKYEEIDINHIGNLTFIQEGKNKELQDRLPEDYLIEFDKEILQKHFIPMDQNLWKLDKYEEFIEKRTELIWNSLSNFIKKLEK